MWSPRGTAPWGDRQSCGRVSAVQYKHDTPKLASINPMRPTRELSTAASMVHSVPACRSAPPDPPLTPHLTTAVIDGLCRHFRRVCDFGSRYRARLRFCTRTACNTAITMMGPRYFRTCVLLFAQSCIVSASTLHPGVLPLIVRNPYLSTWLQNAREEPWSKWPIFWTGQEVR